MEFDLIDRKIVARLMADATIPVGRLAAEVGLSQTPCWKRVQKLKARGVIRAHVAVVDPEAMGFALTVFATVEAPDASAAWQERFARVVAAVPEVMDAYRLAGPTHYLLRLVVRDIAGFDLAAQAIRDALPVRAIIAQFATERVKQASVLPIDTSRH
ncbi:Lrp/AsnC family transcriptional regulator [Mangrovicoccus algicola]|uniref:Lrp/AsnC family transcriptional regulator n=1 Tax=Mangrovicoccus algicola TaxID=2771008 RepID=A0A8J6Z9A3_9RHOB|nr:Lrp/AsnC family transcriptional regulator [Mangrovicoccus algicola]MBE3638321.1 Lrp/AsnC family transcriptional regulator [Mangrovicoccus algicola]